MIAMRAGGRAFLIIDEGSFKRWHEHKPFTADFEKLFGLSVRIEAVQIVWTPDVDWVAAELAGSDGKIDTLIDILERGKSRPVVDSSEQPYHDMFRLHTRSGGGVSGMA